MDMELLAGVLGEYEGLDDAGVAAALNQPGAATSRAVTMAEFMRVAYATGLYARLQAVMRGEVTRDSTGDVAALLKMLDGGMTDVDLSGEAGERMLATLTSGRLASDDEIAKLRSLAVVSGRSRADELGLGDVRAEDVTAARRLLADRATAEDRRREYDAIRERLVAGYLDALAWINAEEAVGHDAPTWDGVVGRL